MANINSFAENINRVVKNTNNQISLLNGFQESILTDSESVAVHTEDNEGNEVVNYLPSWNALSHKVDAISNSINSLMKGEGVVKVGDGTSRTVQMTNIASSPARIVGLENPTSFNIDANWWFENFMYPSAQVSIDLTGKIDSDADRVLVKRVILDNRNESAVTFYHGSGIENSTISYEELVDLLDANNITYSEDEEILELPLSTISYQGNFSIIAIDFVGGNQWYTLDNFQYKIVGKVSTNQFVSRTETLKVGDKLSGGGFLYQVEELDEDSQSVRLRCNLGYSLPVTGQTLNVYFDPFQNKMVNVKFSNDEIDIVYFKGVNEHFNIVGNEWSEPVMFITNDLVFAGDNSTVFDRYYASYIVDWGRNFINEVKERRISAAQGITPNAPSINANDFSVVQINTQVNASLDSAEILNMKADIETTKSRLVSLRSTIEYQQTIQQTITDQEEYKKLSDQINQNITDYKQLQTSYRTSLESIMSLLKENDAIDIKPKYHIRGFFGIPNSVYNKGIEQQIIGFDIQYRYIKEDETGVDLKTYTYTDNSGDEHTGVYSDWNIISTPVLEKVYNDNLSKFVWQNGNISNGTEININQVDIPITKGEKVEFRIRSISEAGYPYCPLKSGWSNSVVISFPSNLLTSSDIENLITDMNDENVVNTVDNQLNSQGLLVHLEDSTANVNSVNNTYFKHKAENISYEYKDPDTNQIKTISVQEALDMIFEKLKLQEGGTK